ncbi:MAG: helix-turn-helix transcriptional regulator [Acidobacteriia bacterium]|nr:helix-turn-helix transcriptional regulator [Terriglobia bacterium]
MAAKIADLKTMQKAAEEAGLNQVEWARIAGVNRSKLNLAVHGKTELSPDEMARCSDALRKILAARVSVFNQLLKSNFCAVAA